MCCTLVDPAGVPADRAHRYRRGTGSRRRGPWSGTGGFPSHVRSTKRSSTSRVRTRRSGARRRRSSLRQGDASLLPKLDAIRAEADRATRQALKPVIDLLKNHANLTSAQSDTRRSAAADLVGTGRPEAITWLEAGGREGAGLVGQVHDGGIRTAAPASC